MTTVGMKIVDLCIAMWLLCCGAWMTHISIYGGMKSIFSNNLPYMVMHIGLSQGILFLCPKGLGNCFQSFLLNMSQNRKEQNIL